MLPEKEWTLLVQAVDQFVPEVSERGFRFLPSWRVDDVMMLGVERWSALRQLRRIPAARPRRMLEIGQMCDSESPRHGDLRILAEFHETEVGAGTGRHALPAAASLTAGVAVDNCMTYSVGFRAPSASGTIISPTSSASS